MKETYSRPTITNADAATDVHGPFPVVEALTKGYAAGKAIRKVFGAEFSSAGEVGIVKRKKFMD